VPGSACALGQRIQLSPSSAMNSLPGEVGVEYICWKTSRGLQTVGRIWTRRGRMGADYLGETARWGIIALQEKLGSQA
jgi:hypothetical protein